MRQEIHEVVPEGHKYCYHCGIIKPLSEFHRKPANWHSWCKMCRSPLTPKHAKGEAQRAALPRKCRGCKQVLPIADFYNNASSARGKGYLCKSCQLDTNAVWQEANRQKINDNAKAKYWAVVRNSVEAKARVKARQLELKTIALTHYGNGVLACSCCGENIIELLTLDHTNNDGAHQRKKLGVPVGGRKFYLWAITNGFPSGYQTLCFSCNIGKHIAGGICPHQKLIRSLVESAEVIVG